MKKMALLTLLLFAATAHAQPQAPTPPQAPPVIVVDDAQPKAALTYAQGCAESLRTGKDLIVYVGGLKSKPSSYGVVCERAWIDGYPEKCIVYARPAANGEIHWIRTTDEHGKVIPEKAVKPAASPFSESSSREPSQAAIADDSRFYANGRWQDGLAFLNDLEPYQSAKRVQQTFRRWSGFIGSVDRLSVKPEWRIAGGLVGVNGWGNQLFRTPNLRQVTTLIRQDESDSSSAVTWWRNYPSGATFADVLHNDDGRIFEVRVAEKHGVQWERYVAFRDVSARPHGYESLTRSQCANCHNQAGNSAYADSAIPGADTIISDPIEPVEAGRMVQGGYGTAL